MNEVFNLSEIADKVKSIMIDQPDSRDDDLFLMTLVWNYEMNKLGYDLENFFEPFMLGMLSKPESITRARRKLQETNPWLRGERWSQRHGLESVMVNELQSI